MVVPLVRRAAVVLRGLVVLGALLVGCSPEPVFRLTLDAVSEIASGPESPDERTADATEDTEYQLLEWAKERAKHRRTQARLEQRRAHWAQAALRRTTLVPGMRTSGFVYAPVDPKAARLVLHVDLGSRVVTVPFRQMRYEP